MTSRVRAAVQPFRLCSLCAARQGDGAISFEPGEGKLCSICGGTMATIPAMARKAAARMRRFEFRTFSVGVSMPDGVQEKEDEMRSELRLKGDQTIKSQASKVVSGLLSTSLRKRVDKMRPDLSVVVDFGSRDVMVSSRPVFFYGRYTKPRGISQHRVYCPECRGRGCEACKDTGIEQKNSVEDGMRKKFASFSGSERMRFTWLGSEDRESKVYPPGRPFVAEVKNPKKRRFPKTFSFRTAAGNVAVSSGKMLKGQPVKLPPFRFTTRITAVAAGKVSNGDLAELNSAFRRVIVTFNRPQGRPVQKKVYGLAAKARGRSLVIDAELDGGLPVKRFVNGELVSPSVSEVLKTEVGCRNFDICGVKEIGSFKFAEIARSKKKN